MSFISRCSHRPGGKGYLEGFHRFDETFALFARLWIWEVQASWVVPPRIDRRRLKESQFIATTKEDHALASHSNSLPCNWKVDALIFDLPGELIRHLAKHFFHHRQMFQILVCLEQGFAGIELDQDTSYRPDVTREGPAGTCYKCTFWRREEKSAKCSQV